MKNLIIYYSRAGQNYVNGIIKDLAKGNSEVAAEFVHKAVGGDIFKIETVKEYAEDYTTCTEEAKRELHDHARPELKQYLTDISQYDNIFVIGPCWWGTYPMAMYTQLERLDFGGKKVFLLMTHEGSGMGSCEHEMKKIMTGAELGKALAVHGADAPDSEKEIAAWAKAIINQ